MSIGRTTAAAVRGARSKHQESGAKLTAARSVAALQACRAHLRVNAFARGPAKEHKETGCRRERVAVSRGRRRAAVAIGQASPSRLHRGVGRRRVCLGGPRAALVPRCLPA